MSKSKLLVISLMLVLVMLMTACNSKDDSSEGEKEQTASVEATTSENSGSDEQAEPTKADTQGDVEVTSSQYSYEGNLLLKGLVDDTGASYDKEIAFNDIFELDAIEETVFSVTSTGEENEDIVKGVYLNDVLALFGEVQSDYQTIRLVAGDGYEITVPVEIVTEKDIILAYEFNGEGLDEKKQPLRAAIDDVRSMYFVSNLVEIDFTAGEVEIVETQRDIVFLETAIQQLPSEDFMYYDSNDQAVLVSDLLKAFNIDGENAVDFVAADGFEKQETMEVFQEGFIKYIGDDAPLFTGLDLSKGMNIKYIMKMNIDTKCFISVASAMTAFDVKTIGDYTGVSLSDLVSFAGVQSGTYSLVADDGYSVEVPAESLVDAIVLVADSGTVSVKYDEGYAKNFNIKNLLTIVAIDGTTGEVGFIDDITSDANSTEETTDDSEIIEVLEWTILFEGLSDGSFELTMDKAGRKLDLTTVETHHMKDDVVMDITWDGFKVFDILDYLHVEDFNSLVFVGSDGYEIELTKEQVDDTTILAIIKDSVGLPSDNKVQLVQDTQFATTWNKDIVKVIVK